MDLEVHMHRRHVVAVEPVAELKMLTQLCTRAQRSLPSPLTVSGEVHPGSTASVSDDAFRESFITADMFEVQGRPCFHNKTGASVSSVRSSRSSAARLDGSDPNRLPVFADLQR